MLIVTKAIKCEEHECEEHECEEHASFSRIFLHRIQKKALEFQEPFNCRLLTTYKIKNHLTSHHTFVVGLSGVVAPLA
jgi:hypothetical protein